MQKRKLGKQGPELTVIGLGTWSIGGPWQFGWGPSDDTESIRTIERSIDLGINWIDTAPAYGLGHAEEIIAKALKHNREKVFIATKCGLVWSDKGKIRKSLEPSSIRQELENSLNRLQTDYIDIYQIHWPDPAVPIEKSWQEMVKLKSEGKVRWIGVSNFDVLLLERCLTIDHVDSLQPPYNLLKRQIEQELIPFCKSKQIGIVAYSPLASGLLSENFSISRLAHGDWRLDNKDFQEPKLSQTLEFVNKLEPIQNKFNATTSQIAIAWTLKDPAISSSIVGARKVNQIEETVKSADIELDKNDIDYINQLYKESNLKTWKK
jgi:aryl-alcohol dehydrogenase-like predicted oxidoreductase